MFIMSFITRGAERTLQPGYVQVISIIRDGVKKLLVAMSQELTDQNDPVIRLSNPRSFREPVFSFEKNNSSQMEPLHQQSTK